MTNELKKRLGKEKRKLYIMIMSVLLIACLTVSSAYAVIILQNEKELLYNSAKLSYSNLLRNFTDLLPENMSSSANYYMINMSKKDNAQIIVKDSSGNILARTDNTLFDKFQSLPEKSDEAYGNDFFISLTFEDFYSSMTSRQYEKIKNYLNSAPKDKNGYYELVCSEFYIDSGGRFYPKTVEIVITNESHDWYAQDEVVEAFPLKTGAEAEATLYKCSQTHRNVIPTDFVLNASSDGDIYSALTEEQKNNAIKNNEPLIRLDAFNYAVFNETVYYYQVSSTEYEAIYKYIDIIYTEKFNILESCKGRLAGVCAIIFVFFLVTGIILGVMMWQILKNRLLQEQKRREITDAMAHDLKTPIFVISGYAQNLKENIFTDKREHYADIIIKQTEAVNSLVHRMLELSKLDSVNFKPNIEEFDLAELTYEILMNYDALDGGKYIEFTHSENVKIKADRELIRSAVENLIENAIKYSEKEKCILVNISNKSFSITNSCENMTKAEAKQIWEPYYRTDKNPEIEGNGLGLSIVKSIFDLHKFKYGVKLSDDKITFIFMF